MGDSDPKQTQFPPLQISDLLVLTLTVGIALAVIAPGIHDFLSLPVEELRIPRWRGVAPEIISYSGFGIALFGLTVLARQRLRGATCTLSPGHWMFVAIGPHAALLIVVGAWREVLEAYWFYNNQVLFHAIDNALFAIVLGLSIAFSIRGVLALELRWRVCLLCILAWLILGCAWCILEVVQSTGLYRRELIVGCAMAYLSAFVAACVAVVTDVRRGIRRDWLHHFALVMLTLYAASTVLHNGATVTKWWGDLYARAIG